MVQSMSNDSLNGISAEPKLLTPTHVRLEMYVHQKNTSRHRVISSHRTQNNENVNEHLFGAISMKYCCAKRKNTYVYKGGKVTFNIT